MRPIKFRGFNEKHQQWLTGNYILKRWSSESSAESCSVTAESRQSSANANRGAHFIAPVDEFADGKTWDDYEVQPDTVGQFTGLTDKQGREIYEGDVLRIKEPNGAYSEAEVSFCGKGYWAINLGIVGRVIAGFVDRKQIEVIGNIHDNPELLTNK